MFWRSGRVLGGCGDRGQGFEDQGSGFGVRALGVAGLVSGERVMGVGLTF